MGADGKILDRLIKNMKKREQDPLGPLLDAYYMERDTAENRLEEYIITMRPRPRPGGRFSPSSIGGCQRQAVFKFARMPGQRRVDPDRQRIFDQGDWIHHKWQATWLDMEQVLGRDRFKVISNEGKVLIPELYIAGNSDSVLRLRNEQDRRKKFVLDIKSINDRGFQYVCRNDEPIPEHVEQLTTYGEGLRRAGMSITYGVLFYENKDTQAIQVFVVQFEHVIWAEVQEWVEACIDFINHEKLPPMSDECDHGTLLYERCPYARWCYGDVQKVHVRRRLYRDFEGIDEEWEKGLRDAEG